MKKSESQIIPCKYTRGDWKRGKGEEEEEEKKERRRGEGQ